MDNVNVKIKKSKMKEKNILATMIVMIAICALTGFTYIKINSITVNRSLGRMQEAINIVTEDVSGKLARDSISLNALAEIIASQENIENENVMRNIMENIAPLTTSKKYLSASA